MKTFETKKAFALGLLLPLVVSCGVKASSSTSGLSESGGDQSSASSQDLSDADLVYMNWNLGTAEQNNLERQMVAAFNAMTGKTVKILENINTNAYEDSLIALAGKEQMPDVFMLTNMTFGLSNQFLADMTSYSASDEDWATVPTSVANATKYNAKVYALPFAIHMMGYFENEELLDEKNLPSLSVSPSWNDFYNVVTTLKQPSKGIMGLNVESTLFEWYPAQINPSLGWFSYDGDKYNLDGADFASALAITKTMRANSLTFDSLTSEQRTSLGYTDSVAFWNDGKLGLRWGYTYEIPDMLEHSTFNKKFIGVPGGRTPIVGDYLGVSPTCKDPQLAYEFAKWMSFSPDGIKERLELDADGSQFSSLPLSTDETVIAAYFAEKYNRMPGLEDVFRDSDNGIVEGVKIIPGYGKSRWTARAGSNITINVDGAPITNPQVGQVIDQCWLGSISWADYAAGLNLIANREYNNALNTFASLYQ